MNTTDWLTLALVVITGFYAWVTFRIQRANESVVDAMRQQTEAQLRPYVVVLPTVRTGTTLVCLEVQNTGKSPALGLRLRMDRDFYPHAEKREGENIAKLPAFTNVIESLAPNARLIFILGVGGTIFSASVDDSVCPKVFHVHAQYEFADRKYSEDNIIDVRPMLHSSVAQDPVAAELERLRKSLEDLFKQRGVA
jgi:hypothetical protein